MSAAVPHLVHIFSTFVPGGPQVRAARLFNGVGEAVRHTIVALDGRTSAEELIGSHVPYSSVPPPPKGNPLSALRAQRALLKRLDADLVLTYNWGAIEAAQAARTLRLPLLHHEDGFGADEAHGQYKARRVWARRLVLRGARAVYVPSRKLERIARELWWLPEHKVRYIANGIDPSVFAPRATEASTRAQLGLPSQGLLVGSVGHLRAEKRYDRLLEALALTGPELSLVLIGDGSERAALEERAARPDLAGRVHFAGHQELLAPWLQACDLFALSSDTEQMPISLVEAMGCGLPVACTEVGDVRAMLPDEQGEYVVPLGDDAAHALGAALDALSSDAELRTQLGRANRARVEAEFDFDAMCSAHRELWSEALGSAIA